MLTLARFARPLLVAIALSAALARAGAPEFRAQWADAFHHPFANSSTANQIQTCVDNLRAANSNVLMPEVRVHSDVCFIPTASFYPNLGNASTGIGSIISNGVRINCDLNSDPEPRRTTSIDHLDTVLRKAHDTTGGRQRIDVWAWLVAFRGGTTMLNAHPDWISYQKSTTDNTLTATTDFDPGHPGVQQQVYNVCLDLVNTYGLDPDLDLDGINFDYIRFTDKSNGYNSVSLQRFRAQYNKAANYLPAYNDSEWKQWRRDQVTAVVRKAYLSTIALKPTFKLSIDAIPWGGGPARPAQNDPNWLQTWKTNYQATSSAYNSVYSDWRGWMEEGIIDLAIPMNYNMRCSSQSWYENWMDFEKDVQYKMAPNGEIYLNRQLMVGPGTYLNTLDDAIYQMKITRNPSTYRGKYAAGQSVYSYASPYAETCGGTIVSDPAGMSTALRTRVVAGTDGQPMYPDKADLPPVIRLTNGMGHIKGTVTDPGTPQPGWVDGATVTLNTSPSRSIKTDGTGFYGFVDVPPGDYTLTVSAKSLPSQVGAATVTAYQVTTRDFVMAPTAPTALVFQTQPGGAEEGRPFASQPVVKAVDGSGAVVTGYSGPVTVAVKYGSGIPESILTGTTTLSAVNGVATFTDLALSLPGESFVLTATSDGLSVDSALFSVAAVPVKLIFANEPLDGVSNVPFVIQPEVWAVDARGRLVASYIGAVTIGIKAATGTTGALIKGTNPLAAVSGSVGFTDLRIDRAGTGYVLVASSGDLGLAETAPINIEPRLVRVSPSGDDSADGGSWTTAMKTVGAAVEGTGPGDEIWVAAGTYTERVGLREGVQTFGGFAGTEASRDQRNAVANPTVLDGNGGGSVVTAEGLTAATVFDGFTLRNGTGAPLDSQTWGGGLLVLNGSPVLTNNVIADCSASGAGGGVYVRAGTPTLDGCTIRGNMAARGGGLTIDGPSTQTLRNLTVTDNVATIVGGGLALDNVVGTLTASTVQGNTVADGGGGVAATGGAQITIARCRVVGNQAEFGPGGGVWSEGGLLSIENTLLQGNAGPQGSGAAWTGSALGSMANVTVAHGQSSTGSGGLYLEAGTTVSVLNTIVTFNQAGIEAPAAGGATFRHNNVFGNTGGNWLGAADQTGQNGNISADPLFLDSSAADYRLSAASPCHDGGDSSLAPSDPLDLAGAARKQGWSVDIGAYEAAGNRPYTASDALAALAIASGLVNSGAWDIQVLDVTRLGDSAGRIDLDDAVSIIRKVTGIDL